ncbi:MAG: hypothetical protein ACTS2F_27685 [Thainema sp.]
MSVLKNDSGSALATAGAFLLAALNKKARLKGREQASEWKYIWLQCAQLRSQIIARLPLSLLGSPLRLL